MAKTSIFNLCNWTGEKVQVTYNARKMSFDFGGYHFWLELEKFDDYKGDGYANLYGEGWDGALTSIFEIDGRADDKEMWIRRAVIWVANHV